MAATALRANRRNIENSRGTAPAAPNTRRIVTRVTGVTPFAAGGRNLWQVATSDGNKIAVANPVLARVLGAGNEKLPDHPIELRVLDRNGVSVALSASLPGEDLRRNRAVDLTDPQFVMRLVEADASEAAQAMYAQLSVLPDLANRTSGKAAKADLIAWREREDIGTVDWNRALFQSLRSLRLAAEEGMRMDLQGAYGMRSTCQAAMNAMLAAREEAKLEKPELLGSRAAGRLHDLIPEAKTNTAISVAWAAYLTISSTATTAKEDRSAIVHMLERAALADDPADRTREARGALIWAWQVLAAKQHDMTRHRYIGNIGNALRNIEIAIQWVGGDIPDLGPLKGLPSRFDEAKNPSYMRVIVHQLARGNPIIRIDRDAEGNAVGHCANGEQVVFGRQGAAVIDREGHTLFETGQPPARLPEPASSNENVPSVSAA